MSIWHSLAGEVHALDGHDDAANYRAEGEPTITIDVAATTYHDHIRLAVWDDGDLDVCALLSPAAVHQLRDYLTAAMKP
jgi:hypothetical protein